VTLRGVIPVVVVVNFTTSAEALTWVDRDGLTELVPGLRYQAPDHFFENTLVVFLNGLRVEMDDYDGFTILDDQTFEMNQEYLYPQYRISVGYVKKSI
jgi:hypothetical protein